MKKIALIHTVKSVYIDFETQLKSSLGPAIKVYNLLDDYLANDSAERGFVSEICQQKFKEDIFNMVLVEPDIIVVTCSTLSPFVDQYRALLPMPIVAIDDEMVSSALSKGSRIMVLATACTAVEPTVGKLNRTAMKQNKNIVINSMLDQSAIDDLKAGNKASHDKKVLQMVSKVKDYDCIVLAQVSMGHLKDEIERISGLPVLTAAPLCIQGIKRMLNM